MKITSMTQAHEYLKKYIPAYDKFKFEGEKGLLRAKYLMHQLGNPQEKLRVIHIAGTSGKGSTAYAVNAILHSLGFHTGLHVSPNVFDIRERIQIDSQLISEKDFCTYLSDIIPSIDKASKGPYGIPTYFEILVALTYYSFWKKKVDYAVIETGLGGLYDGTNIVENKNKVCILTPIGFDHTAILGNTLSKIASQKAGIIHDGNMVISTDQRPSAKKVFDESAKRYGTKVRYIKKGINYTNVIVSDTSADFDYSFEDLQLHIKTNLLGLHQAQNISVALSAVVIVSQRDGFQLEPQKIKNGLEHMYIPARMELFHKQGKNILVDGAHNPQKMKTLITSLEALYPDKKLDFLIGFVNGKDIQHMLPLIAQKARKIVISGFVTDKQGLHHISETPESVGKLLKENGFNNFEIIADAREALHKAIEESTDMLVVTGSFYLIGELYRELKK